MKTTCKDCGGELEITDERTFVKCFKCGSQTIVDVEPPWSLAGLDYVAPPPPTAISDRPPPPLRHDHAPASHRVESLSPLSGELVEGDDLIYVTCENCGKEFEGSASFLRCPFCGVTNTVDTAPPWAVSGDLVQEVAVRPSSVPPPPPPRAKREPPPARSAEVWQEWKTAEVASDGGTTRQAAGGASGGSSALVVLGLVLAIGVGGFVVFAASSVEEETVAAPTVEPPAQALDIDRVEQEIEGVVNAGATTHWSCEKAQANYEANRDPDIEFEPVPDGVFGEVLRTVDYRELCKLPPSTSVEVCAAIQRGRPVGVTVATEPSDPVLERCVDVRVRALRFPSYPALQVARSTFVPLDEEAEDEQSEVPDVPERVPGPLPVVPPSPHDNPY